MQVIFIEFLKSRIGFEREASILKKIYKWSNDRVTSCPLDNTVPKVLFGLKTRILSNFLSLRMSSWRKACTNNDLLWPDWYTVRIGIFIASCKVQCQYRYWNSK